MKYRNLGKSGLRLSELSFGSWVTFNHQVDTRLAERMFAICFDAGINFFDNAEGYERGQSEVVMGKALKALSNPRDSYCVSSKVFFGAKENPLPTQIGLSRKHITEACHQALERLQVDYLDLYFCHRADPDTPISETVWAMHNLVTQGKVLYWGTSEWTAEEISEAPTMDTTQLITLLKNSGLSEEKIKTKLDEWANTPAGAAEEEATSHGEPYENFAQSVNLSLKRYLDAEDFKVGLKEHTVADIKEAYKKSKGE